MQQRTIPAAAYARPGVPGPRPVGRPIQAATMARPVPPQHPAAMPVGRPSAARRSPPPAPPSPS